MNPPNGWIAFDSEGVTYWEGPNGEVYNPQTGTLVDGKGQDQPTIPLTTFMARYGGGAQASTQPTPTALDTGATPVTPPTEPVRGTGEPYPLGDPNNPATPPGTGRLPVETAAAAPATTGGVDYAALARARPDVVRAYVNSGWNRHGWNNRRI